MQISKSDHFFTVSCDFRYTWVTWDPHLAKTIGRFLEKQPFFMIMQREVILIALRL